MWVDGKKMEGQQTNLPFGMLHANGVDATNFGAQEVFRMHRAGIAAGDMPKDFAKGKFVSR